MLNHEIPDRYELKYIISEREVPAIRDALRPFCALDAHSARASAGQYVIESLYLDTPGRDLYRVSRDRSADRFKVRIRRYGSDQSPVFLEVKRKTSSIIRKSRARLGQEGWRERMAAPAPRDAPPAEREFRGKVERHALQPTMLVRYMREAWASTIDGYARVTFDRQLCVQPASRWSFAADPGGWLPIDHREALQSSVPQALVLELKCTLDVPLWMSNLAERFGLGRRGVSKYCSGIERALGARALSSSLFNVCSNS